MTERAERNSPSRICFLYIAQAHQALHSLSVALDLARRHPDLRVDVVVSDETVLEYVRAIADRLGPAPIHWRLLGPRWLRGLRTREGVPPKVPMLLANAASLARYDVIVAPERTTALLRHLCPGVKLVYTQHGAGDRAGPFEPRLARFDLVFAAGQKQRDRIVSAGLTQADRCAVVGYPKFDLVDALNSGRPRRLFAVDRPTVLYNPHFSPKLGSWRRWGRRVLETFAGQDRYNLIFAPHLRLFAASRPETVPEIAPFAGHPAIHIDLGASPAAIDMTYTRTADVYLGDVSSQVYEFIRNPRPCAFLNAHGRPWNSDESYRHWRLGPVIDDPGELLSALDEARRTHPSFVRLQNEAFRYTFDLKGRSSSARAAEAIAGLVSPNPADRLGERYDAAL